MSDLHRIHGRWFDMPTAPLCLHGVHRIEKCDACVSVSKAIEATFEPFVAAAPALSMVGPADVTFPPASAAPEPVIIPDPPPSAPESEPVEVEAPKSRRGSKK